MWIRMLNSADAVLYRMLRLKALQNNPEAFLETYENASRKSIDDTAQKVVSRQVVEFHRACLMCDMVGFDPWEPYRPPSRFVKGRFARPSGALDGALAGRF